MKNVIEPIDTTPGELAWLQIKFHRERRSKMDEADLEGLWFLLIWWIFMTGLHVALAERFKRSKWKWGIIGLFLGFLSFIWLLVLGGNKEKSE